MRRAKRIRQSKQVLAETKILREVEAENKTMSTAAGERIMVVCNAELCTTIYMTGPKVPRLHAFSALSLISKY